MPELSQTARRLLDEPNFAVIATLMPGGEPQTSAVWVTRQDDDSVVFATTPTVKLRTSAATRESRSPSVTVTTPTWS